MQCFSHLHGLVRSVELAALGRRIAETEWDLLELIAMTLHDRPTAAELVAAVREYLERDVMTATEGRVAFHARVAVNVLGMVERELEARAAPRTPRSRRGSSRCSVATGPSASSPRPWPAASVSGSLDVPWPDLVESVRGTVRAKLEVANPGYLTR